MFLFLIILFLIILSSNIFSVYLVKQIQKANFLCFQQICFILILLYSECCSSCRFPVYIQCIFQLSYILYWCINHMLALYAGLVTTPEMASLIFVNIVKYKTNSALWMPVLSFIFPSQESCFLPIPWWSRLILVGSMSSLSRCHQKVHD